MASLQAKVGWKRMGKRENKKLSFRFIPFRSFPNKKFQKNNKKNSKN